MEENQPSVIQTLEGLMLHARMAIAHFEELKDRDIYSSEGSERLTAKLKKHCDDGDVYIQGFYYG